MEYASLISSRDQRHVHQLNSVRSLRVESGKNKIWDDKLHCIWYRTIVACHRGSEHENSSCRVHKSDVHIGKSVRAFPIALDRALTNCFSFSEAPIIQEFQGDAVLAASSSAARSAVSITVWNSQESASKTSYMLRCLNKDEGDAHRKDSNQTNLSLIYAPLWHYTHLLLRRAIILSHLFSAKKSFWITLNDCPLYFSCKLTDHKRLFFRTSPFSLRLTISMAREEQKNPTIRPPVSPFAFSWSPSFWGVFRFQNFHPSRVNSLHLSAIFPFPIIVSNSSVTFALGSAGAHPWTLCPPILWMCHHHAPVDVSIWPKADFIKNRLRGVIAGLLLWFVEVELWRDFLGFERTLIWQFSEWVNVHQSHWNVFDFRMSSAIFSIEYLCFALSS
jgi:hypothetical protein